MTDEATWQAIGLAVIYCGGILAPAVMLYTLITSKGWRE